MKLPHYKLIMRKTVEINKTLQNQSWYWNYDSYNECWVYFTLGTSR